MERDDLKVVHCCNPRDLPFTEKILTGANFKRKAICFLWSGLNEMTDTKIQKLMVVMSWLMYILTSPWWTVMEVKMKGCEEPALWCDGELPQQQRRLTSACYSRFSFILVCPSHPTRNMTSLYLDSWTASLSLVIDSPLLWVSSLEKEYCSIVFLSTSLFSFRTIVTVLDGLPNYWTASIFWPH